MRGSPLPFNLTDNPQLARPPSLPRRVQAECAEVRGACVCVCVLAGGGCGQLSGGIGSQEGVEERIGVRVLEREGEPVTVCVCVCVLGGEAGDHIGVEEGGREIR